MQSNASVSATARHRWHFLPLALIAPMLAGVACGSRSSVDDLGASAGSGVASAGVSSGLSGSGAGASSAEASSGSSGGFTGADGGSGGFTGAAGASGGFTGAAGGSGAPPNPPQTAVDAGPGPTSAADAATASYDAAVTIVVAPDADANAGCANGANLNWAEWPMPNGAPDVDAGAPHPSSYTDNGDGTVSDNVTGLMWQQASATSGYYSSDPAMVEAVANAASTTCQNLRLAGHDDWREPTLIELASLDTGIGTLITRFFSNPPAADAGNGALFFVSSNRVPFQTAAWWEVSFADEGRVTSMPAGLGGGPLDVRCVRGCPANLPAVHYSYVVPGTALDTSTNLTWQQIAPTSRMTAPDALTYCATLSLAGSGWRVPTVKELLTLVDFGDQSATGATAMIDPDAFPGTPADAFWSSTVAADPNETWTVTFDIGEMYNFIASWAGYVRCVR